MSDQNIYVAGDPWGQPGPWSPPPRRPVTGSGSTDRTVFTGPPVMPGDVGLPSMRQQASGGSVISRLLGNPEGWGDLASIAGAFSSGKKADRVVEGNFRGDFDRMMLDRELNMNRMGQDRERFQNAFGLEAQDARNRNEADAFKKLQQTAYVRGGGSDFTPPSFQLGGQTRTAPSFSGIAPDASTAEEIQGATDLQGQLMGRFGESGSFQPKWDFSPQWNYQPTPVEQYARPGLAENIGSYAGVGTGILGALGKVFGGGSSTTGGAGTGLMQGFGLTPSLLAENAAAGGGAGMLGGAGSRISNILGKAAPIAGAATGTIGLLKDRGAKSNIMNGVTAGAGYGSMIAPGIGTAIGAGIGGLVGGLRGLGGPSNEEVAGRQQASAGRQSIISGATPQQQQEAQSSGWQNPQDALTLIVVRDALAKAGKPAEMANQLVGQLHQAEKGGPQAVEQALTQIMNAVSGARV